MVLTIQDHRNVVEEFIKLYKSEPCLWRVKTKAYHDRAKKKIAYKKLVDKLKEIDPAANKDAVVKKINNLRSNARKERKKWENSVRSGTSADDIYHPKLWYYHLFEFLVDQEEPRDSISNLVSDNEIPSEVCSVPEVQIAYAKDDLVSPSRQEPSKIDKASSPIETGTVQYSSGQTDNFTCRSRLDEEKQSQDSLTSDVLSDLRENFKRPCVEEDRFDILGKNVAMKLREADKRQSLIAEKIINDVIFEAELGNLTLQHKCVNIQEISAQANHSTQQHQQAVISSQSVPSPLYSPCSSPIISPTPSPSPSFMQQSRHNSHTNPTQNYSPHMVNQQPSETEVIMEFSEDSVTSYSNLTGIDNLTEL